MTTNKTERKRIPIFSGFLAYFPLACAEVARCSQMGNGQHNPGEPLHWAREKSGDELDALGRHLLQAGTMDTDGIPHSAKIAWRALANLQKELEQQDAKTRRQQFKDAAGLAEAAEANKPIAVGYADVEKEINDTANYGIQ